MKMEAAKLHPLICTVFVFAYVWSMGGNLVEKSMDAFDTFTRELFGEVHDVKVPLKNTLPPPPPPPPKNMVLMVEGRCLKSDDDGCGQRFPF